MPGPNVVEFYHHPLHYSITPKLPPFWRFEKTDVNDVIHITGPNVGWVTVDFKMKGFALGKWSGAPRSKKDYSRQGWCQRLVDDAVKVLKQTEAK